MSSDLNTVIENYNSIQTNFDELKIEIENLHNNKIVYENRLRDLLQMGANAKTLGLEIKYIMTEIKEVENKINLNIDIIDKLSVEITDIRYKCVKLGDVLNSQRVNFEELQNRLGAHRCNSRYRHEDTIDTKFRSYICDVCGEIIAII